LSYFERFDLVLNALDNVGARKHVKRLCLAAGRPLVEAGTAKYEGQTYVIKKGITACYDLSGCAEQQVTLPLVPGQSLRRRQALVCAESVAPRQACAGFRLPTRAEWQYLARAGGAHDLWACAGAGCEVRGAAAVEAWSMEQQAVAGGLWLPYPAGWFWEPNGFGLRGFSDNASEWVEAEEVRALGERCGDSYLPRGASGSLACDRLPVSGFSATTGLRLVRRAE
jgi:hypothetical protein